MPMVTGSCYRPARGSGIEMPRSDGLVVHESDPLQVLLGAYASLADFLRDETAQTLAYVLIQLGAVLELEDVDEIRGQLTELRAAVRPELQRVLQLVAALNEQHRSGRTPQDDVVPVGPALSRGPRVNGQ
jgi:hypothetical protein